MMVVRWSVPVLLAVGLGCSSAPSAPSVAARRPAPPAPTTAPAPAPEPVDPSEPVRVHVAAVRPASWRQAPWDGPAGADPLALRELVAVGMRTALVRTRAGTFAVDAQNGVTGPLALPASPRWIGLAGDDDAVLVASETGALRRARNVAAAMKPRGFELRAELPGATQWDASGQAIAAVIGGEVAVSTDGGATFTRKELLRGHRAAQVLARHDGVVVAVASRGELRRTFVSRDGGQRWTMAAHQPRSLRREGSWIWNVDSDCPALLSLDARQWTSELPPSRFDGEPWRRALSRAAATSDGWAWRGSTAGTASKPEAPPAPRAGRAVLGGPRRCKSANDEMRVFRRDSEREVGMIGLLGSTDALEMGGIFGSGGGGVAGGVVGGLGTGRGSGDGRIAVRSSSSSTSSSSSGARAAEPPSAVDCAGSRCLAGAIGARPLPTRTDAVLLSDGECDRSTAISCVAGAPALRAPSVAFVDRDKGSAIVSKLPARCAPRELHWAGGLAVALCAAAGGTAEVHVADTRGVWKREQIVPLSVGARRAITVAADGTLLLHPETVAAASSKASPGAASTPTQGAAAAFARAPAAVGTPGAWREVTAPDAMTYRPLDGGGVLVVAASSDGKRLSIDVDAVAAPRARIGAADAPVDLVDVTVKQGSVVLRARESSGRGPLRANERTVQLYLSRGGELLPYVGAPAFVADP
jgi:hypothetical protein